MLRWFHGVFLQNAMILQDIFPLFPLWQHPLFCCSDWRLFADDVLCAHPTAEEPMDIRICKVLPHLEETLRSTREVILTRVDVHSDGFHKALREWLDTICDSLN